PGVAGGHDAPVGEDDVGRNQVVASQPVLPGQPADAAAQGEPSDAGVGDRAPGGGQLVGLGLVVEVGPLRPAGGAGPLLAGVDLDTPHRRQVDHEAAVARALPGEVVAPALDRHQQVVLPGELDAGPDV